MIEVMREFLEKHESVVLGTLSCFDRLVLRGNLPLYTGGEMARFLRERKIPVTDYKEFVTAATETLKNFGIGEVNRAGRPFQYFNGPVRKEDWARKIAERDGVKSGLVCMCSVLEPCRTFSAGKKQGGPIKAVRSKCLFVYWYFMDPDFGLMHVRIQTWFPFRIQVYVNGHEWLARQMSKAGIRYAQADNTFPWVSDLERAQKLADSLAQFDWVRWLDSYANKINPLLGGVLKPMRYWWSVAQAEYSTDVLFRRPKDLQDLAPKLMEYAALKFGAADVMSFFGRKVTPQFRGEVTGSFKSFLLEPSRQMGCRVKHQMKENWLKMYDKAGCVLRIETVINKPSEFRVRRRVRRKGQQKTAWVPMRKSVAFLPRFQAVALASNARYLNALACVDDPTVAKRALKAVTSRKKKSDGKQYRALNPLSQTDSQLFRTVMDGAHAVRGFTNKDVRAGLQRRGMSRTAGQVTRMLRNLRAHGLIARIPRTHRWRISNHGARVMGATIHMLEDAFPARFREAA